MYIAFIENNRVVGAAEDVEKVGAINLEITEFQYQNIKQYGNNYYIYSNGQLVLNPDYETEEAAKRQAEFEKTFFNVENYGYYRRVPKGYQSAIESITVAERICAKNNGLPANTLIFYPQPDFTKAEQCTEEWLIEHQIKLPEMTAAQFDNLFITFVFAWNREEH